MCYVKNKTHLSVKNTQHNDFQNTKHQILTLFLLSAQNVLMVQIAALKRLPVSLTPWA